MGLEGGGTPSWYGLGTEARGTYNRVWVRAACPRYGLGTEVRTEFGYGLRVPELGTEVLTEFGYRLRVPELVRLALRLLNALGRVGRRPRPGLQPDHLHRLLDLVQLAHVQRQRLQQQGNW